MTISQFTDFMQSVAIILLAFALIGRR